MHNLVISFAATQNQIEMMKSFCEDKKKCPFIISVRQSISEDMMLSLSVFANRPEIYIGIYSSESGDIISDIEIDDEAMRNALDELDLKFAHALTRESPVVNKTLAYAWMNYINHGNGTVIPLD